jgi:hypothetical protein
MNSHFHNLNKYIWVIKQKLLSSNQCIQLRYNNKKGASCNKINISIQVEAPVRHTAVLLWMREKVHLQQNSVRSHKTDPYEGSLFLWLRSVQRGDWHAVWGQNSQPAQWESSHAEYSVCIQWVDRILNVDWLKGHSSRCLFHKLPPAKSMTLKLR